MEYKDFKKIVNTHKSGMAMISELYDLGFDLMEGKFQLSTIIDKQFDMSLSLVYTDAGIDWVTWFIYDSHYGTKQGITASDTGESICYSVKSLWEYIEKHHTICE
jgi:hypothetical protein